MRLWRPAGVRRPHGAQAFTLSELLIASTIFMFVVAGVVATNLFGLRMIELTEPKQQAAQRARQLLNELSDDISTAWQVEVGNGTLTTFVPVPEGSLKRGSALKIVPYASDTNFVVYYKDAVADEFLRDSTWESEPTLVAWGVTNTLLFSGESTAGQPLTRDQALMVVGVTLQFSELESTRTPIGAEYTYKGYQFKSRLTWRAR